MSAETETSEILDDPDPRPEQTSVHPPWPRVTHVITVARDGTDEIERYLKTHGSLSNYTPVRFRSIHPDVFAAAIRRGTDVHMACADLDRVPPAEPYWEADPLISAYVGQYRKFKNESGFSPTAVENFLLHNAFHYVGRADRFGTLNGAGCVLDIKTGARDRWTGVQLAAYAMCVPHASHARFSLHLTPTSYRLIPHTAWTDSQLFLAALTITGELMLQHNLENL